MIYTPYRGLLTTATQLQWSEAYIVISPDMQNNDRKSVFWFWNF